MLFVSLPDADWSGAEIEIDHTVGAADTWAYDDDYDGSTGSLPASAYDVALQLSDWLNAAGRPWFGSATWSRTVVRTDQYVQIVHTVSAGTFDVTPNATAEAALGITTETTATSMGDETGDYCAGSLGVVQGIYLRNWLRVPQAAGAGGTGGGYMMAHIPTAARLPFIEAFLGPDEVVRLNDVLEEASTPRWAWIYDSAGASWRHVALARAEPRRRGPLHWHWQPEVMGGGS